MTLPDPVVVIQTAFLGDVVLTLPVVQALRMARSGAAVDVVVAPRGASVLDGHPDIRETIVYDKAGRDAGPGGFLRIRGELRRRGYAAAIVPHRSLRSALLARFSGIPLRVGFDTSAGRTFFTHVARYDRSAHEIDRNLALLEAAGAGAQGRLAPRLHPREEDRSAVDRFLADHGLPGDRGMVSLAPGTAWNTKRWPGERFAALARLLAGSGRKVVLVGGPEDAGLCAGIAAAAGGPGILDASGRFGVLASAELIRRTVLLVCNDSAPLHLAGAVGTPVLSIFGATTPSFGFGPTGAGDRVVQIDGLSCRPCSIHGGERCPVGTFDCMERIGAERVFDAAISMMGER